MKDEIYVDVQMLAEPTAFFWNIYLGGPEPPTNANYFRYTFSDTQELLEALKKNHCDSFNIFTPPGFPAEKVKQLEGEIVGIKAQIPPTPTIPSQSSFRDFSLN